MKHIIVECSNLTQQATDAKKFTLRLAETFNIKVRESKSSHIEFENGTLVSFALPEKVEELLAREKSGRKTVRRSATQFMSMLTIALEVFR